MKRLEAFFLSTTTSWAIYGISCYSLNRMWDHLATAKAKYHYSTGAACCWCKHHSTKGVREEGVDKVEKNNDICNISNPRKSSTLVKVDPLSLDLNLKKNIGLMRVYINGPVGWRFILFLFSRSRWSFS